MDTFTPQDWIDIAYDRALSAGSFSRRELHDGSAILYELELVQQGNFATWLRRGDDGEMRPYTEAEITAEREILQRAIESVEVQSVNVEGLTDSQISLLFLHREDSAYVRNIMANRLRKLNRMQEKVNVARQA